MYGLIGMPYVVSNTQYVIAVSFNILIYDNNRLLGGIAS